MTQQFTNSGKVQTISGSGEATIEDLVLLNEQDERIEVVNVGQLVKLRVAVRITSDISELVLGYMIKDRFGQPVFGTNTYHLKRKMEAVKSGTATVFTFQFKANLGEGTYSIATALHAEDTHIGKNYEWRDLALIFTVVNANREGFVGVAWLPPTLDVLNER